MNLSGSVALVTGANRGLGARLVAELLSAGAAKVYATARTPGAVAAADPRVQTLALDVTDPGSVTAAAAAAPDVTVLVNNAGVLAFGSALDGDLASFERDLRTNYLGSLRVTRAFVPALERNAPAAVVNVLTLLGAYPGGIDTDMLAGVEIEKAAPEVVAQRIVAGLAAGETVVFPDDISAGAGSVYLSDPLKLEQMLTA